MQSSREPTLALFSVILTQTASLSLSGEEFLGPEDCGGSRFP
jgi:hypothetical protein